MTFGIGANRKDLVVFAVFCGYGRGGWLGEMARGDGERGRGEERIFVYILSDLSSQTSLSFLPYYIVNFCGKS
ncbi:MAG: hypothetical protein F6K58_04730 [Symploca sp. SIO2E9]|nr:hypothetical protein [Symploca sp. SIO2E9]